jgi:phospholipid/cholesterol/gamma-HCH transport system substrate-binding protein
MRMRTLEIMVGAFLLAGILALVFLAVRVSGVTAEAATATYSVNARFHDVAGLRTRAKVTIAGVTVGRVSQIGVDAIFGEATVTLDIQADIRLPRDSGAAIQTEGILGGRYVALLPGADEELLEPGGTIVDTQGALVLENLIGDFLTNMRGGS